MGTARRSAEGAKPVRSRLPAVKTFVSHRWWWTTLLVLVGVGILVRLGLWQLDRREQRRAYNAAIIHQLALPLLPLNGNALPSDLDELKNRQAVVQGTYDLGRQVALMHQNWASAPGFHLITPLVMEDVVQSGDSRPAAVLVDRGWLPAAALPIEYWSQYDIPGPVTVTGFIKKSQSLPREEGVAKETGTTQAEWYRVDITEIQAQMPYALLPIYLQEAPPVDGDSELPFRTEPDNDLSEGNHLSYAIQWFIFASILAVGYVYFVGKRADGMPADVSK